MKLWPRFVRTPWQWVRDCYHMAAGFVILALLAGVAGPRCQVCRSLIPPCGGNYQCVHRTSRRCIKHMAGLYAP